MAKPGNAAPSPTYHRIAYGPHERHLMDIWLAESVAPTPVLFSFHPTGFKPGPKWPSASRDTLRALNHGITVVAPTYRQPNYAIAPAPFHDAARAVQYIRSRAGELNIDPDRGAATGASSGGCLSLWLAFHRDLAQPDSHDPVARESTRLTCAAVTNAPTSVDPRFIRSLMPASDTYRYRPLAHLLGIEIDDLDRLPDDKYRLMEEASPITHIAKDAPPTLLRYSTALDAPYGIHHPVFGQALKRRAMELGVRCDVLAGGKPIDGSERKTILTFVREAFA